MAPAAEVVPNGEVKRESKDLDIVKGNAGIPSAPTFKDPLKTREYLKFRLAQAFRIFGTMSITFVHCLVSFLTMHLRLSGLRRRSRGPYHCTGEYNNSYVEQVKLRSANPIYQDPVRTDCFWVNVFVCPPLMAAPSAF